MTATDQAVSATPTAGLDVGQRVRYWRRRRGMSQRVLADFAGISQPYISQVEAGNRTADRRSTILRLAEVLRVSPAELTGDEPEPEQGPVTRVRDVEVVHDGDRNVVVVDSRTRRPLLQLTPQAAASLCVLIQARAAAARPARQPVVEPAAGRHS